MTPTPPVPEIAFQLRSNADYMADNPPATIETDSDLWCTTIALQREGAAALLSETQARHEAERKESEQFRLRIEAELRADAERLARQQAERELKASQDDHATLGRLEARARLRLREKLTLSEQARAQAEQARADLVAALKALLVGLEGMAVVDGRLDAAEAAIAKAESMETTTDETP